MTQRSALQVQILEKLGAPLMSAVSGFMAGQQQEEGAEVRQEAERVAELLGKAVQVSISLAAAMDLKGAGDQDDSVRLALAAMAGRLIAGQYRQTGRVPADNDIKRMVKALEAILAFSDNFTPAAENTARLQSLEPGLPLTDENQVHIQYVGIFVPVANIVAAFPFGRPENKLMQEVAGRLVARAGQMREKFIGAERAQEAKQAELTILQALAQIYVECHREEMNKLMAMDEQARAKATEAGGGMLSMDPVWQAFDLRAGMVELLGRAVSPEQETGGAAEPSPLAAVAQRAEQPPSIPPAPPPETPSPPPQDVAVDPQPETQPVASTAAAPDNQEQAGEQGGGEGAYNPMGFFKPKTAAPPAGDSGNEDGA